MPSENCLQIMHILRLLSRRHCAPFGASPLLEKGGVFLPLRDVDFFRTRLTVLNDAVAWDIDGTRDPGTCVDLNPCEMYETCPIVDDPLREVS